MTASPPFPDRSVQSAGGSNIAQAADGATAIVSVYQAAPARAVDPAELAAAVAHLAALPLDGPPEPGDLPAPHRMPFPRNRLFTGREPDLCGLARRLKDGGSAAVGQSPAVTGLGGQGKTQLAVEFAYRYGRWFRGGVFFVSCADPAAVPEAVAACGLALGAEAGFSGRPLPERVAFVAAAWTGPLPRLLIFDNCEDEALLDAWAPKGGGCRLLLTARRAAWPAARGIDTVPLGGLSRPESVTLLRRHRPDLTPDDPVLADIADELGDLPLALDLAGGYLARYRREHFGTPGAYLAELRRPDLLAHASLAIADPDGPGVARSPTGHELHVARTFALSLDRLRGDDPTDALARRLLAHAAWLAPGEPIPAPLLRACAGPKADDADADRIFADAAGRLLDLALAERAGQADGIVLHRLVAAFARTRTEAADARAAVETVVAGLADHFLPHGDPTPFRGWAGHLLSVAAAAARDGTERAIALLNAAGFYCRMVADYAGGLFFLQAALDRAEAVHGPDHPQVARTLTNLGTVQQERGDLVGAQDSQTRALAIFERAYGPDHPEVARTLGNLGTVQQERGDRVGAQDSQTRALAIFERAYGPDHPEIARTLGNLGTVKRERGDRVGAQDSQTRALAIFERAYGPDHPEVARTLGNLGTVQQERGDRVGAQDSQTRALAIKERAYGPDHPEVARTLGNLGLVQRVRGNLVGAQDSQTRALAIEERAYGPDHPEVARTLGNLGIVLRDLGRIAEARQSCERALAIFSGTLGEDHPHTAQARRQLAGIDAVRERQPWWRRSLTRCSAAWRRLRARWFRRPSRTPTAG